MPQNPFGSFRNVFEPMDSSSPFAGNRKRFLSNVYPVLPSRQIQTPQAQAPDMQPGLDMSEPEEQSEGSKYFDEMESIRTRRGPALSAYQQHLEGMPTRETTKPSIGRRIGAGLVGAAAGLQGGVGAGLQTAMGINETPYARATQDWSNQAQGLGESARLEREEVEGQLKALSEARALGLDYDEYELKRLETLSKMDIDERAQGTRDRMADITQKRDQNVDERERSRIENEVTRTEGQLDIGRTNAKTGQRRAATAEAAQKSLENYRTARLEQLAQSSGASPNELGKAMENALLLLGRDPAFADFINSSSYPPVVKNPREIFGPNFLGGRGPSKEQYDAFNRRLREAIESQINEGKLITGDEDGFGDEDDFDIGEPEF